MTGLFWNSRRTRTMTKAEAERFMGPEETGRRLVVALRAWLGRALDELPAEARAWYRVELEPPQWLDPGHPHLALNECRRLVNGIPDAAPGWMDWTSEQARAVGVLHAARAAVVATAKVPAPHALMLLERALDFGIELARSHVEPWEAAAIDAEQAKQERRADGARGGSAKKRRAWAEETARKLAENARGVSENEAWKRLPEPSMAWELEMLEADFVVYKDGDQLHAVYVPERDCNPAPLKRSTFLRNYFRKARDELGK